MWGRRAATTVRVATRDALARALREATPGTRIEIAPGEYAGGLYAENVRGEPGRPIVIAGPDPERLPVLRGGGNGLHLAGAAHVEVANLRVVGATDNGINIDDGGKRDGSARGIVLRGLHISDIGPTGNHHCLKLSGLDDFRVEECRIERWGGIVGQGIDCVGCHRGLIVDTLLRHEKGERTGGVGIQTKGGSRDIRIRRCRFEDAGRRAINAGGSTGVPFFRPPLESWPAGEGRYEARNIRVEGCTFVGSDAPVAFVGVDGAAVRFCTIYVPNRWALRILQETDASGFVPARGGVWEGNVVVFRADRWVSGGVNVGAKTAPETFRFAENWWYNADAPERSRPALPTPETGGVYGRDPLLRDPERGDLRLRPGSPAAGKAGAEAFRP